MGAWWFWKGGKVLKLAIPHNESVFHIELSQLGCVQIRVLKTVFRKSGLQPARFVIAASLNATSIATRLILENMIVIREETCTRNPDAGAILNNISQMFDLS